MIIVALSDLHGDVSRVPAIKEDLYKADVVLLTGDLTHFGHLREVEKMVQAVRAYSSNIWAVPGNCDYEEVDAYLSGEGFNLHGRHEVLNGIAFLGVGGSLPCPGTTPNEFTEEELKWCLSEAEKGLDPDLPKILVTHQPPRDTKADRLKSGLHVGSQSLCAYIVENRPLICFSGHIHEGQGVDTIGSTYVVNPGPFGQGSHVFAVVSDKVETLEIHKEKG